MAITILLMKKVLMDLNIRRELVNLGIKNKVINQADISPADKVDIPVIL